MESKSLAGQQGDIGGIAFDLTTLCCRHVHAFVPARRFGLNRIPCCFGGRAASGAPSKNAAVPICKQSATSPFHDTGMRTSSRQAPNA
jgi:hypothetical protein